jgi:pimeloyl-ACP methyl ester carboxylesterase
MRSCDDGRGIAVGVVEGTVCTSDGRSLAYAQMGQLDGSPLLYFHGNPGSRLDWDHPLNRPVLNGSGVRLIGIDRPGFGGSTHQSRRRYADWPADVLTVANVLELERFAILGYSGGAPYTIACALAFPERLTFVGIVSGVDPTRTLQFGRGVNKRKVMKRWLFRLTPAVGRWYIKQTSPAKYARLATHPVDHATHPGAEEFIADAYAEATRNGPHGLAEEWRLRDTPSGLDLAGVECPVRLWHGESDGAVPLHHAEHVVKLVPKAQLEVLPGVGHFHSTDLWRTVFQAAQTSTSR